ncbi:hypothetical protein ACMT4L_16710 [Deinococcus sp. A31D244]|uniref:hypothetical protein n=1 Tax=Deinococcus sp. A31D244 TaxID=3397675 RepID=UPI0039E0EAA9
MEKSIVLKSLYIGIQEDGTPGEVQIQRIERWTGLPEGMAVPDVYLPLERFGLLSATDAERVSLDAVLSGLVHAQAAEAEGLRSENESLQSHAHAQDQEIERLKEQVFQAQSVLTVEQEAHKETTRLLEETRAAASRTRAELDQVSQELLDTQGEMKTLRQQATEATKVQEA